MHKPKVSKKQLTVYNMYYFSVVEDDSQQEYDREFQGLMKYIE